MASSRQVLLLAVVAAVACLVSHASAVQWMVGDDGGWRAQFNQTGWADGKTFVVGDSLIFMYSKENHTVAQVGEDDFAACNLQANFLGGGILNSGNDVVTLDTPGTVWFICTKPSHCDGGMKLVIDVVDLATTPAPAPEPSPFIPFPGVPAPAPEPSTLYFPSPPLPWGSAPAAPASPPVAPESAAMRNPVGAAVATVVAAVVVTVLAF